MKVRHNILIIISGVVWLAVGIFLLSLGLKFLIGEAQNKLSDHSNAPMLSWLSLYIGGLEQAAILLVAIGLLIGYMKGRYVLGKSAARGIQSIRSFQNPTYLYNIYSVQYYILLASMIGLGLSIKFLGLPVDIRGIVDTAIGAALISGSTVYFRNTALATAK